MNTEEKLGKVYCITCKETGKCYVGLTTKPIEIRLLQHFRQINAKVKCTHLSSAIKKYGREAFSVSLLEECPVSQLNEREIYWIEKLNTFNDGYNLTTGGKFAPCSEATKRKLSVLAKGRIITPEHRAKIAATRRGQKLSDAACKKISAGLTGRKVSEETKRMLSSSMKESEHFSKLVANLRAIGLRRCRKIIVCDTTDNSTFEFESVKAFARKLGVRGSSISTNMHRGSPLFMDRWKLSYVVP